MLNTVLLPSLKPINIIIVDDSLSNLAIIKEVLDRPDINVITCSLPTEVMDICIANEVCIALIDIQMPEMSGFELLTQLKNNPLTESIPVILMTGHSMSSADVYTGLTSGAVDYLFKPLDLNITNAKINSLLTLITYQRELRQKNNELELLQADLKKALKVAKKARTRKENFLANMSHEIRTPLNAIIGITNLLKSSALNEMQWKLMQLMDFSSNALFGIVNDILESFQIDAGKISLKPERVDVISLFESVGEVMRPLAIEKGLGLNVVIKEEVPNFITADPLRLKQILMNLINNAIKFTNEGTIDIILSVVRTNEFKAELEFSVRDSGLGIPEEAISQIFERFEQVQDKTWQKFGGTGLGLSIVKRLVELMGGSIEVKSILGTGTTFSFTAAFELPNQLANESVNLPQSSPSELQSFDNVSVLLAEDNLINQSVTVMILEKWNVYVDVAENGLEAFNKIQQTDYDLVLMDTHMPVMNGHEATRKIRTELKGNKSQIPIISFSASVIEDERQDALEAGVNDFLEKPFTPADLHSIIKTFTQ